MALTQINLPCISYCEIPQHLTEDSFLTEALCDSYMEYVVVTKKEQKKYDDDFSITNWIIENYPELEGKKILIHIDY